MKILIHSNELEIAELEEVIRQGQIELPDNDSTTNPRALAEWIYQRGWRNYINLWSKPYWKLILGSNNKWTIEKGRVLSVRISGIFSTFHVEVYRPAGGKYGKDYSEKEFVENLYWNEEDAEIALSKK